MWIGWLVIIFWQSSEDSQFLGSLLTCLSMIHFWPRWLIWTGFRYNILYYILSKFEVDKKNNLPTEGGCGKAIFLKISKNHVRHGISYARITQLAMCNSDVHQNDTGQAQLLPKFHYLLWFKEVHLWCSGFDKECLYDRV